MKSVRKVNWRKIRTGMMDDSGSVGLAVDYKLGSDLHCSHPHLGKTQHVCPPGVQTSVGTCELTAGHKSTLLLSISPKALRNFRKIEANHSNLLQSLHYSLEILPRLKKWDKFPVMAPERLAPSRLRQFHVI